MAFLSKDGKWYNTSLEAMTADRAWQKKYNQQQEQNRLLEEQNRLLEEQKEQEKRRIREQREQQEQQRIHEMAMLEQQEYHEKEMAKEREKHDQEMRLLQLFDSIGLHKSYYDKLETYLFAQSNEVLELDEEKTDLEIELLDLKLEEIKNNSLSIKFKEKYDKELMHITDKEEPKIETEEEKILRELKSYLPEITTVNGNRVYNPPKQPSSELTDNLLKELDNAKEFKEFKELKSKYKKKTLISGLLILIPFFCILLEIGSSSDLIAYLYLLLLIIFIGGVVLFATKSNQCTKKMNKIIEDEIASREKNLTSKETKTSEENKQEKLYKEILKEYNEYKESISNKINELDNKIKELMKKEVQNKWTNFTEFRKNHFNSGIEKLLLDTGMQERIIELGLVWPKINKNNMIKEGTVDDYIAYIDEL